MVKLFKINVSEGLLQDKGALYLQNTAGVHCDVVLQVSRDVANTCYTCCENFTI